MQLDFETLVKTISGRRPESEVKELKEEYENLLNLKIEYCTIVEQGECGDPKRISLYANAHRHILLHRAISLFEGAIEATIAENGYVLALSVRGLFETTASLGYLHNRLTSLSKGNLESHRVDMDIMTQFLGTNEESISEAMSPVQVMKMLDFADRSVSKAIFDSGANEHKMLRPSYEFLCEFAHPNFHSNKIAYDLDKENSRLLIRHGSTVVTSNDHEWDAVISVLAVANGITGKWTNNLHSLPTDKNEKLIEPCGQTVYWWPQ